MQYRRFLYSAVIVALIVVALLPFASKSAQAQTTLPTAATVADQIKVGWNLGNTLEAQCGETAWGNPATTQALIDSVKAAGFNSIRIPAAWDCHADQTTLVIDPVWMARVKQVVDYAVNDGMYVVLNIHWDGGWLENHVTYADQVAVNAKQKNYWTQIANYFKSYDQHLLFAGTNETHQDYGTPTAEYIAVQQSYLQTFVDAVRATGGNNASRTLVLQTYNTNIAFGLSFFTMPTDTIANRMIVEVHYYDPYDYTLNASGSCLAWGAPYTQYSNCAWAQEAYLDNQFALVKAQWIDAGIPVIIGEYGVAKRSGLDLASRQYYLKYMNAAALVNGLKTYYWDNGVAEFALFDRVTGAIVDQSALNAVIQGSSPCTSCTATPSRTPTRTPTITPTACGPACGSFAVSIKSAGVESSTVSPFNFSIKNTGASAISGLSTRIYFTLDGANPASNYSLALYYDGSGAGVVGAPVRLTDKIYSFPVDFGAASLAPGATWEFQLSFHLSDWATTFNPANDWFHSGYAVGSLPAAYAATSYIPVYVNGSLAAGSEPNMGPTNTPGPSNTPGLTSTPTLTPARTNTPTLTLARTNTASPTLNTSPTLTPTKTLTSAITLTKTSTSVITLTPTRTSTTGPTLTRTSTVGPTATRTSTATTGPTATVTPTQPSGGCSPVTSTITAPFTYDGAGAFCWQSSNLGAYINSWNTTSVSINGVNATNLYVASGSYPAKINGYWYVSYNSAASYGHFEAK